jgi:hypothetical protein
LFVPGFADNSAGLFSIVSGAYQGIPPGPSGDGTLAFVEFSVKPNGILNSTISIEIVLVTQGTTPWTTPPRRSSLYQRRANVIIKSFRPSGSALCIPSPAPIRNGKILIGGQVLSKGPSA